MNCKVTWAERKASRTQLQIMCDEGIANALLRDCTIMDYNASPRRKGVGTAAYSLVEGELRKGGCKKVELIRVNPESAGFWRKLGYKIKGSRGSKKL